jgi:hypothetical protein
MQSAAGALPALSALGGTNSLVSVDATQEFRIQTSSFPPEFGRTPGAQISIATRSGTNGFHGTLFDYFRNGALDAKDWFANYNGLPKSQEQQNDFGGVIGGPIVKDKTFFFFSYEGLRLRQSSTMETVVPDVTSRQQASPAVQPYLIAYPLPNGVRFGAGLAQFNAAFSNPSTLDAYRLWSLQLLAVWYRTEGPAIVIRPGPQHHGICFILRTNFHSWSYRNYQSRSQQRCPRELQQQ